MSFEKQFKTISQNIESLSKTNFSTVPLSRKAASHFKLNTSPLNAVWAHIHPHSLSLLLLVPLFSVNTSQLISYQIARSQPP